ncbi:DoxX family protein [Frigoribacterium sp. 2-23]|uniref:DoxX family protein n=1 Tax=Frigoribacterium sp. 2-23 TaxID=3415006 RepID=UPI003C700729
MTSRRSRTPSTARPALRLAALLAGSGVLHFVKPAVYDGIVPRGLPGEPRAYTLASGAAELGIAAALLAPRTRRLGGTLAALLFVAVFPANVVSARKALRSRRASTAAKVIAVVRLPLQWPLVTSALSVRRAS